MAARELAMTFADVDSLQEEFVTNLQHGRAFVRAHSDVEVLAPCALVLEHPETGTRLAIDAQVVLVTPGGVGLELRPQDPAVICAIERFVQSGHEQQTEPPPSESQVRASVRPPSQRPSQASSLASDEPMATRANDENVDSAADEPASAEHARPPNQVDAEELEDESDGDEETATSDLQAVTRIQALRALSLPAQLKLARTGELSDRVQLERLYGKSVWEALLENPRITIPEIARISRKGTVPRILLEQIVDNRRWINQAPVRRALLANSRISSDAVLKLLRATPRHELKTIQKGTAYTAFIREQARKLLVDPGR